MVTSLPYRFIDQLKALPFVEAIYLFGSRARGDNQSRSDIDIAIKMTQQHEQYDWLKVVDIIDKADTLLNIDCVDLDKVSAEMVDEIYKEGRLLYGKTGT